MKTNDSLCGGRIDPRHFPSLARYLARFVEAYEAEGIRIHALTPQNEPGYFPRSYPTCGWTASQQRDFIGDYLGPEFQRRGIATKIWCYDHNFNNLRFPTAILSDPRAAAYVDGTAFHHYEGKPSAMTKLHDKFPDKHVYFSEGSVFGLAGARQIIDFLRNRACSYNAWVTVIDQNGRPNPGPHNCSPTCIVLDRDTLALDYRFDYYLYGQFMKFIRPGAVRIQSNVPLKSLPNVAVRNRDASIALVVTNLKHEPVGLPAWIKPQAAPELTPEGVVQHPFEISDRGVSLQLDTVDVARLFVFGNSTDLQNRYRQEFARIVRSEKYEF